MSEVGECALRMSGEHIPGSRNARAKALGQAAAGVLQEQRGSQGGWTRGERGETEEGRSEMGEWARGASE